MHKHQVFNTNKQRAESIQIPEKQNDGLREFWRLPNVGDKAILEWDV
jgi:hypothetical protein